MVLVKLVQIVNVRHRVIHFVVIGLLILEKNAENHDCHVEVEKRVILKHVNVKKTRLLQHVPGLVHTLLDDLHVLSGYVILDLLVLIDEHQVIEYWNVVHELQQCVEMGLKILEKNVMMEIQRVETDVIIRVKMKSVEME